jgi:uncharacterized RDD family membrane protein YckC
MFCTRCGKEVGEGNRFCQTCGQEVGTAVTAASVGGPTAPMAASAPISAPLPYAGFWIRFVAHLVDSLILGIPSGIVVLVLIFRALRTGIALRQNPPSDPQAVFAMVAPILLALVPALLFLLILQWLYFAGMESSARQATVGKMAMSLRVADTEGQRLSFGHATGRFFAKIVSGLIPFAIGYIMAGFTAKKQALHDLIAGTLVLKR